jgi:hypothetical protein
MSIIPRDIVLIIAEYVNDPRSLVCLLICHKCGDLIGHWINKCRKKYFRKMIIEGEYLLGRYIVWSKRLVSNDVRFAYKRRSINDHTMDSFFKDISLCIIGDANFTMKCMIDDKEEPSGLFYASCGPIEIYGTVAKEKDRYVPTGVRYRFYDGRCVAIVSASYYHTYMEGKEESDQLLKEVKDKWSEVLF